MISLLFMNFLFLLSFFIFSFLSLPFSHHLRCLGCIFMRHVTGLLGEFVFFSHFLGADWGDGRNKEAFCVADDIPLI